MSKRTPAEQLGIVIGNTVVREDWYRFDAFGLEGDGLIIVRDNHITMSAGSATDAPVFKYWQVEQTPELLAALERCRP